ncbi:unnamed protein product [Aphanomyces euteiches]|nr:hypothetical protein AeRB84_014525 [Aphanomyces euteiches]
MRRERFAYDRDQDQNGQLASPLRQKRQRDGGKSDQMSSFGKYEVLDPCDIERLSLEEERRERRAAIERLHEKEMQETLALSRAEQEEEELLNELAAKDDDDEAWKDGDDEQALAEFKAKLEEKRQKHRDSEALWDERMMEAVMQASLAEHNARGQIEKQAEEEEMRRQIEMDKAMREIERQKAIANAERYQKVQRVLDMKRRAHAAKESARLAMEEYQLKERERQVKLLELEEERKMQERQQQLDEIKRRQEEAIQRREEAERRAQEAAKRAQELREKALAATKSLRPSSRRHLEAVLAGGDEIRDPNHHQPQSTHFARDMDDAARIRLEQENLALGKMDHAVRLRNPPSIAAVNHVRADATAA